ncbi:DUF1992 domain-containing protein [Aquibacillus koreensis]|uniref:DUF1992 domain-containing protein n=1 Tax=Aquibacillus koreensis TaxID=279446 RepID=A0A9X4AJ80_9BACI|nr:DnaJ family domain-containing protein [Aquibacillus koreensis]MCT2534444.1 DUF1992 domain-containing protein [Aquibacillus koreensis]MDC3421751.1 DUF1992 domain-containing protein [Aquibacillus koreensis]
MGLFDSLAEERIKQAARDGVFDNLPGSGKPLPEDDLSGVPDDMRMGYRIMKNAGFLPEEVQLNKEIVSLRELIDACDNEGEKGTLERKLTEKEIRYQMLLEKRQINKSKAFHRYSGQINRRIGR